MLQRFAQSWRYAENEISSADGFVNSVFWATTLFETMVFVVTVFCWTGFALTVFATVLAGATFLGGAVLRVLVLRAGFAAVDLETVVEGINAISCELFNYTGKGVAKYPFVTILL